MVKVQRRFQGTEKVPGQSMAKKNGEEFLKDLLWASLLPYFCHTWNEGQMLYKLYLKGFSFSQQGHKGRFFWFF